MSDYPDWTRLFQLAGTEITIPINIEASDVTLPVTIAASDVTLFVYLTGQTVLLQFNLYSSSVTLDVNIESQDANITFTFADQSVAVFDAAKWFAHEADQVFASGTASGNEGDWTTVLDYTVPAGKVFYAGGVAFSVLGGDGEVYSTHLRLYLAAAIAFRLGEHVGRGLPLDVPLRATAGQHVQLDVEYWGVSASAAMTGSAWGYLEDA